MSDCRLSALIDTLQEALSRSIRIRSCVVNDMRFQVFHKLHALPPSFFARARTVISVTHRLALVAHADWIFVLHIGRLAEQGTHAQLLKARGVYAQLRQNQHTVQRDDAFAEVE